ncbi:protein spire homolog 1 [Xyrauchen texanus]|uniref:protein spire homolog 1 n=1 Tax=Xyrauchen texanus TaxID=154827 RepID=UPI0022421AC1|nr:protein spire homolog 1 [Xyrauchen texanus]
MVEMSSGQMSLSEILQVQDQPVSEEQAWALCYQLCSILSLHSSEKQWKTVVIPAADGVLFSRDGSISLRMINNTKFGKSFVIETEEQAVEFVGRFVYSCLDWGLETQVERELNEMLEILVCQMTKVNLSHTAGNCFQSICSLSDVLQVCKERLYDPSQAAQHYKSVCSTLFLHTIELCHYMQIVQQSRESLQKLILESETKLVAAVTKNWVSPWQDLVKELSRGVVLRPSGKSPNANKGPLPMDTPPFNQLLQDIKCRRYTLRNVQATRNEQRTQDPHQTLLEYIRSRPKLRPVSERKMGLKPKEQSCPHELLMQEIRSTNHCKRLSSHNRGPTDFSVCTGKRRTRSFASNKDLFKVVRHDSTKKGSVLTTIVDVMKKNSSYEGDAKDMSCDVYSDCRVCSCCAARSLYFTWHNICSLCRRVICPGCCVEMRLPSKCCVNLPLSFFKQIVMKDGEQSQRNFWNERWSWDSAWIPLVLVSCGSNSKSVHSLAMRDWYSQDICVGCQKILIKTCDSVLSTCPIKDSQEI